MSAIRVNIKNRKARFEFEILDTYTAGIQLTGTEIKSLREGKASINEGYCYVSPKGEVFIKNMHIAIYDPGSYNNHEPLRERKLLLNRQEISKIHKKLKEKGLTLIPLRLFINNKGLAKLDLALGRGKKLYDKRQSLKDQDTKRDLDRALKR